MDRWPFMKEYVRAGFAMRMIDQTASQETHDIRRSCFFLLFGILGKDEVTGSNPVISSRNPSEMKDFFVV